MRVELIVSEPFEDFEVIKGHIPEPVWKAWAGAFSVRFMAEDGRQFKLPAAVYFRLKYGGTASIKGFRLHGKLVLASLRVLTDH